MTRLGRVSVKVFFNSRGFFFFFFTIIVLPDGNDEFSLHGRSRQMKLKNFAQKPHYVTGAAFSCMRLDFLKHHLQLPILPLIQLTLLPIAKSNARRPAKMMQSTSALVTYSSSLPTCQFQADLIPPPYDLSNLFS